MVVLRMEISEHVWIVDLGIVRIAQPVPRILDGHAMAFVTVRPLFGGGRGGDFDGLVHASALNAVVGYGKAEAMMRMSALGGKWTLGAARACARNLSDN